MTMTILICFKKYINKLQDFENKLILEKVYFDKQINNYIFNDKDINIVQFYIIYFNLLIINQEFFVKQYIKLHKNLSKNEINKILINEYKRFGQ